MARSSWSGGALCALVLAGCASENTGPEPPHLTSILISLASTSIGIGQSQTVTGQARDQHGAAMSGVSFTWASSNEGVATVSDDGVVTGASVGTTSITASSGSVTSNAMTVSVVVVTSGALVIDKASVFLPAIGATARLTAQYVDEHGAASPASVTWTSSAPAQVSVDASGQLQARAIGSAQIFAVAGGTRSAPTLVVVAEPQSGALVVTDAEVVSVGSFIVAPGSMPGVGTRYDVTLRGVTAPAPGSVVLAGETAPIAGKVVTTREEAGGLVVTLELAPLYQLLRNYDISWAIDLAAFPAEELPALSPRPGLGASWNAARRGQAGRAAAARLGTLEPFRAFDCKGNIKPQLIDAPIRLSFNNNLTLVLDDRPGHSKHALVGSATLTGNAGLKLKAGFSASGRCVAETQITLPILGWVSLVVMPAVRFGLGAEVNGEVKLVQGELSVDGTIGLSPVLGWECGGATPGCRGLDGIGRVNELKTTSRMPSANDMEAEISAQFYVLAGLDLSLLAGLANAEILEARVGPKQSFNLAFEDDQAARTDYASSYDLKLEGVVEPGSALKKAIEMVINDDATGVRFQAKFTADISDSPKGTLTASESRVRPDAPVDFTVVLEPATLAYFLLGYNVTGVELYRKGENEPDFKAWKSMSLIASNRATYRWVPTEADAGKYEFAAFANTQLLTPLLEVGPNSIRQVEVSCFSGGSPSIRQAVRLYSSVCIDAWSGTSEVVLKTPGLPNDNITSRANITWTYDPAQSSPALIVYNPTGTFDLAINSSGGCTFEVQPRTFAIAPSASVLSGLGISPLGHTYTFLGHQLVDYTVTARCPDSEDVVTPFHSFPVNYAQGSGPYELGQATLSGSYEDGAIRSSWSFARP